MAIPPSRELGPTGPIPAREWHERLYARKLDAVSAAAPAIQHFVGTPAAVEQPPLIEDVVCIHLGGAKRVIREARGRVSSHDAAPGSLTIMPRLCSNRWRTIGPIDFVHIIVDRRMLSRVARDEFEVDVAKLELRDDVGILDPLLGVLGRELARETERNCPPGGVYIESLVTAFLIALLRRHSSLVGQNKGAQAWAKGGMAGWRLKRVTDFIEDRLGEDVTLEELATVAGLSRAQFYRSFTKSAGASPARYLKQRRVAHAKRLLEKGRLDFPGVAAATGFSSREAFARAFRDEFGLRPQEFLAFFD